MQLWKYNINKKDRKDVSDNNRVISLLDIAEKIFWKVMLLHIADEVLPETQRGLRESRCTIDTIFSARQLQ